MLTLKMYFIAGVTILFSILLTAIPLIYTKCGEWNTQDCNPEFPDATPKVKYGVLIGFLIASMTVLLLAIVIVLQENRLNKQKESIRLNFIARFIEALDIQPSSKMISSSKALRKEIGKIDTDEDGMISKEELWKWVSTGIIGVISAKDFNLLFSLMDTDNNGVIDFSEFFQLISNSGEEMSTVVAAMQISSHEEYEDKMIRASKKLAKSNHVSNSSLEV